jgi:hypothetical protein
MSSNAQRKWLFAIAIFSTAKPAAQSPSPTTLVKAGRLLDPRSGNVLSPAAVLIENAKIKEVGPPTQVQAHAPKLYKLIPFILGHLNVYFPSRASW